MNWKCNQDLMFEKCLPEPNFQDLFYSFLFDDSTLSSSRFRMVDSDRRNHRWPEWRWKFHQDWKKKKIIVQFYLKRREKERKNESKDKDKEMRNTKRWNFIIKIKITILRNIRETSLEILTILKIFSLSHICITIKKKLYCCNIMRDMMIKPMI